MKTLFKTLLASCALLAFISSCAQTKKENDDTLSGYYNKAKENVAKIKSGESEDKESNRKYAEEAARNLAKAKAKYKEMKAAMPQQYNTVAAPHYAVIERYHTEADKNSGDLTSELAKGDYNAKKAKAYAEYFYTDLTNAQSEHEKLQGDVSFK